MIQLADTGNPTTNRLPSKTTDQQLHFSRQSDVVVVLLPEDMFDLLAIVSTGETMMKYVENSRPQRLVISFDRVRTCGSQAVGDLIKLAKKVRAYGGDVKLCSMSLRVREVFELCHLIGTLFDVYNSTGEAVESLTAA